MITVSAPLRRLIAHGVAWRNTLWEIIAAMLPGTLARAGECRFHWDDSRNVPSTVAATVPRVLDRCSHFEMNTYKHTELELHQPTVAIIHIKSRLARPNLPPLCPPNQKDNRRDSNFFLLKSWSSHSKPLTVPYLHRHWVFFFSLLNIFAECLLCRDI